MSRIDDRHRTLPTALGAALLLLLVGAAPALAQDETADGRWLPFVGCWEAVGAEEDAGLVCIELEGEGARLSSYVGAERSSSELLVADGSVQPVTVDECTGTERIRFSEDGLRAFTSTEFSCGTDVVRRGSGIMAFVSRTRWADIRMLESGDDPVAWVQEYRLVGAERIAESGLEDPAAGLSMMVRPARAAATSRIEIDDVLEATEAVDGKAVETWLVASRSRLDPDADDLIRLAEANVPDGVIDAVVALSHPDRFVVDAGVPPEEAERPRGGRGYRGFMAYDPFWGPRWGLVPGLAWSPFGFGFRSGWAGWGGAGWGFPGWGYGFGYGVPVRVSIDRRSSGRIFNGRGYSSGRSGASGRSAAPRGGSQPSYSIGGRRGSSAPSASSGSGSGSRRATPRRATRRPSGGR